MDYDLLIRNGRVVDGSGLPSYVADVGIKDGKIAQIGREKTRCQELFPQAPRCRYRA